MDEFPDVYPARIAPPNRRKSVYLVPSIADKCTADNCAKCQTCAVS